MKKLIKSEKFIYIMIAFAFLTAFLTVYLKTEKKLEALQKAEPVVIHDVTAETQSSNERTVYITRSGKKYHLNGCDYLGEKKIAISMGDALNAQYEACAYCQP